MKPDRRPFGLTSLSLILVALLAATSIEVQAQAPTRVLIWCEGETESQVYPRGVDVSLAESLSRHPGFVVNRVSLNDPEAGLAEPVLDAADVVVWWGRARHDEVPDDRAEAVAERVRNGKLGLVALYASCGSKPFRILMQSMPCEPGSWREDGRPEFVAVKAPEHPIAAGVSSFVIPKTDMFSEPFAVPEPETVVFVSNWERGETVRSGMTWSVGKGRVAYLRTGSESFPVLHHPSVRLSLSNAVGWVHRRP